MIYSAKGMITVNESTLGHIGKLRVHLSGRMHHGARLKISRGTEHGTYVKLLDTGKTYDFFHFINSGETVKESEDLLDLLAGFATIYQNELKEASRNLTRGTPANEDDLRVYWNDYVKDCYGMNRNSIIDYVNKKIKTRSV